MPHPFVIDSLRLTILAEEAASTAAWDMARFPHVRGLFIFVKSFLPIHAKSMRDESQPQVHLKLVSSAILRQVFMPFVVVVGCHGANNPTGPMENAINHPVKHAQAPTIRFQGNGPICSVLVLVINSAHHVGRTKPDCA
jgi:hypothetical protein